MEELEFGNQVYDYDTKFPLLSELRRISVTKKNLKLSAVVYKCWQETGPIVAFGFEFESGHKSPIFETSAAKAESLKKLEVDTSRQIC